MASYEDYSLFLDQNITYPMPPADWGVFAAYGGILLFGFFGNLSLILLGMCDVTLQNTANLLITNIAVSDFLVIVLCVPTTMVLNVKHSYPGGLLYCQITFSIQVVSACLSSLTLAALSYERCHVITNPLGNRGGSLRRKVTCICVLIWALSIAVGVPIFMATTDFYIGDFHSCQYVPHFTLLGKCLKTLIFMATFGLPFMALAFFTYRIARCLFASIQENKRRFHAAGTAAEIQLGSRRKLAFIVCVMVSVFVVSWLPYHIFIFAQEFWCDWFLLHNFTNEINKLILIPPYFSSAVNPWIMYTMSTGYRQKLLEMIRCGQQRLRPSPLELKVFSPRSIPSLKYTSRTTISYRSMPNNNISNGRS